MPGHPYDTTGKGIHKPPRANENENKNENENENANEKEKNKNAPRSSPHHP
jgi:hypothetical protein